jgi:hypothetical protein
VEYPQAAAWERLGAGVLGVVARYFSLLADPRAAAEVRQIEDRLGLNPASMLKLRWELSGSAVAADETWATR